MKRSFTDEEITEWPEGFKRCTSCNQLKPFDRFGKHHLLLFGLDYRCKDCRIIQSKKEWASKSRERRMYDQAKSRAAKKGREFDLKLSDIVIPSQCPVFGVPFDEEEYKPSIDRIDSSRGYTRDNIFIMSKRANVLKNNATPEELKAILDWMDNYDVL